MSVIKEEESVDEDSENVKEKHNTSVKSVSFAPMESTLIGEQQCPQDVLIDYNDYTDILCRKNIDAFCKSQIDEDGNFLSENHGPETETTKCQTDDVHIKPNQRYVYIVSPVGGTQGGVRA